jgi:hypothetical protein
METTHTLVLTHEQKLALTSAFLTASAMAQELERWPTLYNSGEDYRRNPLECTVPCHFNLLRKPEMYQVYQRLAQRWRQNADILAPILTP